MADLSISAGEACDRIEGLTGDTTAGAALKLLNHGYFRVMAGMDPRDPEGAPHIWSFLRPLTTITVWPTATGTTSGDPTTTLTATAATFYASMVGATVSFDTSGNEYVVASYTSTTVVVLATTAAGEGDAEGFTITSTGYLGLPADFGGVVEPPVYIYSSTASRPELLEVSAGQVDELRRDSADTSTGTPTKWCVVPRGSALVSTGQRYDLWVGDAITDTARTVRYRYRRLADALTDSTAVFPIGGPVVSRAILWAGMAEAEIDTSRGAGVYAQKYAEAMAAAIDADGSLYDSHDVSWNMSDV